MGVCLLRPVLSMCSVVFDVDEVIVVVDEHWKWRRSWIMLVMSFGWEEGGLEKTGGGRWFKRAWEASAGVGNGAAAGDWGVPQASRLGHRKNGRCGGVVKRSQPHLGLRWAEKDLSPLRRKEPGRLSWTEGTYLLPLLLLDA